jgi:4-amino-4-deoxy-L-arabinose transferase-like glycosyltransferase
MEFIKKKCGILIFVILTVFAIVFSVSTLTTKPKLWTDEAVTIELAHNFLKSGVLDVEVEPRQFTGFPYLLQATGYPLTVVLALAFKMFGFNLVTERLVMLSFVVTCIVAVFLIARQFFGKKNAVLSTLLLVSFASFFGSGMTAVGEIPGFVFLIIGLYFWLNKKFYYWAGLFLGLSVVTKPSVFLMIIPTVVLVACLERQEFFKKIFKIGLGMIPVAIAWILLVIKNPFTQGAWLSLINYYRNPFSGATPVASNVVTNLLGFFHSTTLIYFGLLFLIITLGRVWLKEERLKSIFNFVIIYTPLAFIYYLRSPGWLRYILIAELLILVLLPVALSTITEKFNKKYLVVPVVLLFTIIQFANLFFSSQIYSSKRAIETTAFLNKNFPTNSIGVYNAIEVSVFLQTENKYQNIKMMGLPQIGNKFILQSKIPEVLVYSLNKELDQKENSIIKNKYQKFANINGYEIYTLK